MPSSPPQGGSPQPRSEIYQPETSTNQRNIPTRDIYRADIHPPRSGNTISRNHDSYAMPRTVEDDTVSHVYPQFSSWSPMKGCHYPKRGGMKGERKHGATAIKEEKTSEEERKGWRERGKLCQIKTRLFFLHKLRVNRKPFKNLN